jgi:hypothetical protein
MKGAKIGRSVSLFKIHNHACTGKREKQVSVCTIVSDCVRDLQPEDWQRWHLRIWIWKPMFCRFDLTSWRTRCKTDVCWRTLTYSYAYVFMAFPYCTSVFFRFWFYLLYTAYTLLVFSSIFALILGSKGSLCISLMRVICFSTLAVLGSNWAWIASATILLPPLPTAWRGNVSQKHGSPVWPPFSIPVRLLTTPMALAPATQPQLAWDRYSNLSASTCNKGTTCTRSVASVLSVTPLCHVSPPLAQGWASFHKLGVTRATVLVFVHSD